MDYCKACYCRKVYCRGCKSHHCKCSYTGMNCRTWFRKHLNESDYKHRNGRFAQRSRPYGDYLYKQDREKFEADFQEWRKQFKEAS